MSYPTPDIATYAEHIIPAAPSRFGRWAWETFCTISIGWSFDHVEVIQDELEIEPDRSILLVGNHVSWWDGFWPIWLNARHIGKDYHVMMLEEQLRPRMFMTKGGAFSIQPGSRSMLHSLNYAADLLKNPHNLVLMFPQGVIHSQYQDQMEFAPGVERLLKKSGDSCRLTYMSAFTDYFSNPKPTLYLYLKSIKEHPKGPVGIDYQGFYDACMQRQIGLGG